MKYTYLFWVLQLAIIAYLAILFNFELAFQVRTPSMYLRGFFLGATTLVVVLALLYILFQERVVKKILFSLASSTTLLVALIIIFIVIEGAPAFQENNPIDFLTGTEFRAFYQETFYYPVNLTTHIDPYNVSLTTNVSLLYLPPDSTINTTVTLVNMGELSSSISLKAQSNNILVYLEKQYLTLPAHQKKVVNLSITTNQDSNQTLTILATINETGKQIHKQITCVLSEYAYSFGPEEVFFEAREYAQKIVEEYTVKNHAASNNTIIVTIEENDRFRPFIRAPEWNHTTHTATFELQAYETRTFELDANLVQIIEGTHTLNLTAQSQHDPSLQLSAVFNLYYEEQTTLLIPQHTKHILTNSSARYPIRLSKGETEQIGIKITGPPNGWNVRLLDETNQTLLSEYGTINITVNQSNSPLTQYLHIRPINQPNNTTASFQITAIDWGSQPEIGILTFIIGTLVTTIIAVMIAAPLGLGCAIFLAEFCPKKIRHILRPIYELLAGIPSVIYGLWGVFTLSPILRDQLYPALANTMGQVVPGFSPTSHIGRDILTASIILSIMILPIIITLSEDSIRSVRRELKEGSLALGTTRWQTLSRIILPQAKSGVTASIILGTGRAIGETMAVLMIMGLAVRIPTSLFDASSTMTGVIADSFGWAFDDPPIRHALFAVALILFIMVFVLNIIIFKIEQPPPKKQQGQQKKLHKRFSLHLKYLITPKDKKQKKFTILPKVSDEKKTFTVLNTSTSTTQKQNTSVTREKLFTDLKKPLLKPMTVQKIVTTILVIIAGFVTFFVFYILSDVIITGAPALSLEYFIEIERMAGIEGGFLNAIVGSLYLVGIALAIATPLSIGSALYIQEYAKTSNLFTRIIMFASDTLASTPSIVYGAFGFMFFVITLGFQWSLLAGGLTLGIMIIPLMLRSSIEALKTVTDDLREGSYAVGATQWQTIVKIVLPAAIVGIVSGVILSVGRAIGETAAVLLTAGYAMEIPGSLLHQAASLPNMIYNYFQFAAKQPMLMDKLYAVALVLIIIVLLLNGIARLFGYRYSRMMKQ